MISVSLKKRIFTSLLLLILVFLIFKFSFLLVYTLIILGTVSCVEFFSIIQKNKWNKINIFFVNCIFTVYIFIFCIFFFYFTALVQLKIILLVILLSCIASDIGGFIFGKIFQGPKLTKISPNKTISGSFGSLIFSGGVYSILIYYFTKNFELSYILIGTLISVSCQVGDLFFSYLKRRVNLKDTGNFLPGHGGVLDRIDGILIGLPFGFLIMGIIL